MKSLLVAMMIFLSVGAFAQDDNLTIVAVGEATLEKDKMVIQDPYMSGTLTAAQKTAASEFRASSPRLAAGRTPAMPWFPMPTGACTSPSPDRREYFPDRSRDNATHR